MANLKILCFLLSFSQFFLDQVSGCDGNHCCKNAHCGTDWCEGGGGAACVCADWAFIKKTNTGDCKHRRNDGLKAYGSDYNSCVSKKGVCGYCGLKQASERSCSKNGDCTDGWCDGTITFGCRGTCMKKREDGAKAHKSAPFKWDYNSCTSLKGQCGYCGPSNRNDLPCNEDSDCTDGWCEGEFSGACSHKCAKKIKDNEKCPQRSGLVKTGINAACESGNCMGLLVSRAHETVAYCRPHGGFLAGLSCTQDSDCSAAGNGHWCNGGSTGAIGKCERCPNKCNGGCHACDNDKDRMLCGRSSTLDKIGCGAEVAAKSAVSFIQCMTGGDLCFGEIIEETSDCISKGECIFEIGEECLNFEAGFEIEKEMFEDNENLSLTVTGSVDVDVGLQLTLNPKEWTFKIDFITELRSMLNITLANEYTYEKSIEKKLGRSKTLMKRVFMVGKIPVLLELAVTPMAWIDLTMESKIESILEVSSVLRITQSIELDINKAKVETSQAITNTDELFSLDKLSVEGNFEAEAALRVGPRIQLKVYKIPITLDIAPKIGVNLNLEAKAAIGETLCLSGSIGLEAGLDVRVSALFTTLDPIVFARDMCNEAASVLMDQMNLANALIDRAQCFTDLANIDTEAIDEVQEDISDAVGNFLGEICDEVIDIIVPKRLQPFSCIASEALNALQSDWSSIIKFEPKLGFSLCKAQKVSYNSDSSNLSDISACDDSGVSHYVDEANASPFDESSFQVWDYGFDTDCNNNVALRKPTSQSSNYMNKDGLSEKAVDGNTDPSFSGKSVSHTQYDDKAWWEVDLQDNFMIKVVKVYNRQDCCSNYLDNFDLIIMDNSKEVWRYNQQGTAGKIIIITVPVNIMGNKVKVQLRGRNNLMLAEVEVLGYN